jgi:hypothetical protein
MISRLLWLVLESAERIRPIRLSLGSVREVHSSQMPSGRPAGVIGLPQTQNGI